MRGKAMVFLAVYIGIGITPAYAGKSVLSPLHSPMR